VVAGAAGPGVLTPPHVAVHPSPPRAAASAARFAEVASVLRRVLVLNLAVAAAKIALGLATGAISILSDGLHSATDSASNVVGLIGVRMASRPPDDDHPYGHRKFETMASLGVLLFLLLALFEILQTAIGRLRTGGAPVASIGAFGVMAATLVVNIAVAAYEKREARRLQSEVLLADAHHTTSDILTSCTVIVALIGVWAGYPTADGWAALVVAVFIGRACWEIFSDTSRTLGDRIVLSGTDVRDVVCAVPGVLGCHQIRSRGTPDYVFLDLHVWLPPDLSLMEAHAISHVVKDRVMEHFPQVKDAVIHIEPPPDVVAAIRDRASRDTGA
jgi:cation diffusion facilitator family transporter